MAKLPDKPLAIKRAKDIVKDLAIEEPSHLSIEAIAFHRGAFIKEGFMQGADGRLVTSGARGIITVREDIPEWGRKRFVMAHELGHYELHRQASPAISCSDDDFLKWNQESYLEVEANYFAGELLMPEEMFRHRITRKELSAELLNSLADTFSTSLTATAIRVVTLRPEYALVCSTPNRIKWFVIDTDWCPIYLNIHGKVHPASMVYECFQGRTVEQRFLLVEPEAWTDRRIKGKLKELVIPMGSYEQALSFLFIEEGWDDY
jgi:hypothetical protein